MSQLTMAASTLCVDLLAGPRIPLTVEHRGRQAWQLSASGFPLGVSLLTPGAVRLPQAVVVSHLPSETPRLSIGRGALWYDDQRVSVRRWFRPARVTGGQRARRAASDHGLHALLVSWLTHLGRGGGLTPYGDDVICGVMLGLLAAGDPRASWLADGLRDTDLDSRTTATSAALLRCAAEGWCIPEVDRLLRSLSGTRPDPGAVAGLLLVGHSSGRGLLAGLAQVVDLGGFEAAA